jgi:hypothetical protein
MWTGRPSTLKEAAMGHTQLPSRLRIGRSTGWLAAAAIALAPMLTAGVQAQAASTAVPAGALTKPAPIHINTTNWSGSAGFGARGPAWYTDGSGVVHLQGGAHQVNASGANANLIGTLPPAARPAQIVYTIVNDTLHGYADLAIGTDGTLRLIDPRPPAVKSYDLVSLESISYRPATPITVAIPVNTANWTGSAGFGSRAPTWYTDRSGIVHLQGAASQTSASGATANLLGTLPTAARPAHIVYVVTHTFEGTYTDLAIGTDGSIRVIPTRLPLVTDFTFVSLESITYRR